MLPNGVDHLTSENIETYPRLRAFSYFPSNFNTARSTTRRKHNDANRTMGIIKIVIAVFVVIMILDLVLINLISLAIMATKDEILKTDWLKSARAKKDTNKTAERIKKRRKIDRQIASKRRAVKYLNVIGKKRNKNQPAARS